MPRFKFELDTVLRMRKQEERERQGVLAALLRERMEIETALRQRDAWLRKERDGLRSGLVGIMNVVMIRQQAAAALSGERRARLDVLRLAGIQKKVERAAAEVALAARKRRALEILREQRYAEWSATQRKREQSELDDLSGTRIAAGRVS